MKNRLSVRLHGRHIGTLWLKNGGMRFQYAPDATCPISQSLPLGPEVFGEKICLAYFDGLLPENDSVRQAIAKKYDIDFRNSFKLLGVLGRDCAGALRFQEEEEPEIRQDYIKLRAKILASEELRKLIEALPARPFFGQRISLAGAQEKAAVCVVDGQIGLPEEDVPTTHVIKTALARFPQSIQNEYLCMTAAQKLGLQVAATEIRQIDDLEFLLIERFDRETVSTCHAPSAGAASWAESCDECATCDNVGPQKCIRLRRILQEDFAQALGVPASLKYKVSFKQCKQVLDGVVRVAQDKAEFLRRVIFNYLIGNTDAHGKNFSLAILGPNLFKLTPAYDLLSTTVYRDVGLDLTLAMKIGRAKFAEDVTEHDWELLAEDLDISYNFIRQEIGRAHV